MTGASVIRDPLADHLITPQNSALVLIDYQPPQFSAVRSMDPDLPSRAHLEMAGAEAAPA
jgi:hypothetical protein